ncbi:MAG: hypothetical protein OEU33_16250, partial [Chromatiales bacterium]|nr:hypothetical protein [Chromatiales bacterium]
MNAMRITLLATLTVLTVSGCVRSEDALDNAGFSDPVNQPTSKLAIAAPPDITQEARARSTAVELGQPSVDGASGNVDIEHDAPADGFPVGRSVVTWTAIDSQSNSDSDTQTVLITDTTPPALSAPADIVANAIAPGELTVVNLGM